MRDLNLVDLLEGKCAPRSLLLNGMFFRAVTARNLFWGFINLIDSTSSTLSCSFWGWLVSPQKYKVWWTSGLFQRLLYLPWYIRVIQNSGAPSHVYPNIFPLLLINEVFFSVAGLNFRPTTALLDLWLRCNRLRPVRRPFVILVSLTSGELTGSLISEVTSVFFSHKVVRGYTIMYSTGLYPYSADNRWVRSSLLLQNNRYLQIILIYRTRKEVKRLEDSFSAGPGGLQQRSKSAWRVAKKKWNIDPTWVGVLCREEIVRGSRDLWR